MIPTIIAALFMLVAAGIGGYVGYKIGFWRGYNDRQRRLSDQIRNELKV